WRRDRPPPRFPTRGRRLSVAGAAESYALSPPSPSGARRRLAGTGVPPRARNRDRGPIRDGYPATTRRDVYVRRTPTSVVPLRGAHRAERVVPTRDAPCSPPLPASSIRRLSGRCGRGGLLAGRTLWSCGNLW